MQAVTLWSRFQFVIGLLTTVLTFTYPFIVGYILAHPDKAKPFAVLLIYLGAVKLLPKKDKSSDSPIPISVLRTMGAFMLVIGVWVFFGGMTMGFQIYPIIVSVCFLFAFSVTLTTDESMIERFASLYEKNITAKKREYMRNITVIWCGFFIINVFLSAITWLTMSATAWTWYNGVISYLLMGMLFVGEYIYRRWVFLKRANE